MVNYRILTLAVVALFLSVSFLVSPVVAMEKDGVMMKDGKMMMMKDGKMMPMDREMTMSNGTKVMKDGKMMMKDGEEMNMKDGQMMMMDGKMMDGKMMGGDKGKMGEMGK